jgi:hypothetical protein
MACIVIILYSLAARAEPVLPPEPYIVSMAQHFVQDHFMQGLTGHHHIEFDLAYLHSRMEHGSWVVVGSFVSDQNVPNTFIAAVQLKCPDFKKVDCWTLEKLAINGKLVDIEKAL